MRYLIIDERSFVGQRLFAHIDARLQQIMPATANGPGAFGGLSVLLFGDDGQLPPVRDSCLYSRPTDICSAVGYDLYKLFKLCVNLTTVFRQDDSTFRDCLARIRDAVPTDADIRYLHQRYIDPDTLPQFATAPRLFATRAFVTEHNLLQLARPTLKHFGVEDGVEAAVARIDSIDGGVIAGRRGNADLPPRQLLIKNGARVMLRTNLCVPVGLVNGSLGTVVDIVYRPGERPPDPPFCVLVQFDQYRGPSCMAGVDSVVPVFRQRTVTSGDAFRSQFPLRLSWAMTIHK